MTIRIGCRWALFTAALAGAVALMLLAACGQGSQPTPPGFSVIQAVPSEPVSLTGEGDTAVPQPNSQSRTNGAYGFSHFFFEEVGGEVITILVEGPAGEQVRTNLSYMQLKQIYDRGDPPPDELRMTGEEFRGLVGQLDTVRQSTEKYQDVEVALKDGYQASPEQFPNMGAHSSGGAGPPRGLRWASGQLAHPLQSVLGRAREQPLGNAGRV